MGTLGTARIQRMELHWPEWGGWWARVTTSEGTAPEGPVTMTIGDLSLVGSVLPGRSGFGAPSSWSAIVASAAAWSTVLPPRPAYQNDAGVRLKTILGDLARDCSATIAQPTDGPVGPFWARPRFRPTGRAWTGKDELDALVRARAIAGWWSDTSDVTQFGARPTGTVSTPIRSQPGTPTRGLRVVGADSVAAFAPGKTWDGIRIARIILRETGEAPPILELWDS